MKIKYIVERRYTGRDWHERLFLNVGVPSIVTGLMMTDEQARKTAKEYSEPGDTVSPHSIVQYRVRRITEEII